MKVAHIADIHIRGTKYLDEMRYTFERLYESLRDENYDLIVIAGDIFHSKLTVSNEYFDIASEFFKELKLIADVIIIPGNHDLALNNKARMDAITPVVKAIKDSGRFQLIYSKYSESFPALESTDKFQFHHFSILDKKEVWKRGADLDKNKVNIALYHGAINGIKFDNGWVSRGNKDDIDIFDGYDFGFLGDIHVSQFLKNGRVAYPGSLRQNNYGESIDKGFIKWEIEDKDDFKAERVILPQKRYFFTLYGKSVEDVAEIGDLAEDSRIRFQLTEDVDVVEQLKIKSEIEKIYSPHGEVSILPPSNNIDVGSIKVGDIDVLHENIREPEVQKELIKEYFKDKSVKEEDLQKIRELDKIYHSHVETDVERNVTYKIKSMEWKNLFSYGLKNKIKFENLSGLIGIFGDNAIGKSSVMDILSLGLTNQVHKEGATKNVDFINRRTKKSDLKIELSMEGKDYRITKTFEKKTGKNGENCVADVDFVSVSSKIETSLNGETKPDTNQNIRKKFGTYEDLNYKEICHQFGLTSFIDARGTKRKETLSKYFDLDVFNTKFKIAKEDFDELKAKLKDYDYSKLQTEIESKKLQLEAVSQKKLKDIESKKDIEKAIEYCEKSIKNLYLKLNKTEYTNKDFQKAKDEERKIKTSISDLEEKIKEKESLVKDFNYLKCTIHEWNDEARQINSRISSLSYEIKKLESEIESCNKTSALLKKIPNVSQCKLCPLAHNAFDADAKIPSLIFSIRELKKELDGLVAYYEDKNFSRIGKEWQKSEDGKNTLVLLSQTKKVYVVQLESIEKKIEIISANLEEILRNEDVQTRIDTFEREMKEFKSQGRLLEESITELASGVSVLEFSIKELESRLELCEELSNKKYIFELYLDAMGKDGISYWIISKKMPIVNKQVNFILSQAVNFKLFIEDSEEEKKVKIYIVDEKGRRPIELASGMEKTISAIALRAALWNICLLPKTPILILDEAFAHLDAEKYDSIIKLLVYLKTYFDAIFIITHDEGLKSVMDNSFYITKDGKGYAKCQIV